MCYLLTFLNNELHFLVRKIEVKDKGILKSYPWFDYLANNKFPSKFQSAFLIAAWD